MAEITTAHSDGIIERRQQRGTWPWFVLNVLLFPGPAHFTLLRIKDYSFGKSVKHLAVSFLLICILLLAAVCQIVFPAVGRLWMLFPALSGFLVLYANRSLRDQFTPVDIASVTGTHGYFVLFCVLMFTLISTLPNIDLITLNQKPAEVYQTWLEDLPIWQDLFILVTALLLLSAGYITNSVAAVSINRAFVLYACFFVFGNFLLAFSLLVFNWLKIPGGFGAQLVIVLLGAILALDYWDARSFGQYTRRFFFLTCTKGFTFMFLWLCLLGFPQKAASTLSAYYFDQSRPAVVEDLNGYLVFSHGDRFRSAHKAARQLRSLYARAFYDATPDELHHINKLLDGKKGVIFPADADVCHLSELIGQGDIHFPSEIFGKVPMFRPIHPDWDVMLTALLMQGTISKTDLNNFIADFKTTIPNTSQGRLPGINTPYHARYVSLATKTHVDFVPPRLELLEVLLEKNTYPVLSLRLAGKNYWATLLDLDSRSGIAWVCIETVSSTGKSLQILFDSDETNDLRGEILSRCMAPLSLAHLRSYLEQSSEPVIVFTRAGLEKHLPGLFVEKDLSEMQRAVAVASDPALSIGPVSYDPPATPFSDYVRYKRAVASIKAMLYTKPYDQSVFSPTETGDSTPKGLDRLVEIEKRLGRIGFLRDCDRIDIAYLLVRHNHVNADPGLFVRLTTGKTVSSDLIDCRDAFRIGRELFLLGFHEQAYRYLELAFSRHPFDVEYELWYHIVRAKLDKPEIPFYSPPEHEPHLYLYYQTLVDIRNGRDKAALKRLEHALEKDSHNSLANHLVSKYFGRPLDKRHFFPAQEGL